MRWLSLWLLAACGGETAQLPMVATDGGFAAQRLPDFSLEDVSSTSASAGQRLSPRGYLGLASGWYFSHAT